MFDELNELHITISVTPISLQFQAHVPDVPLAAVAKIANARTAHVKDAKNEGIFSVKMMC